LGDGVTLKFLGSDEDGGAQLGIDGWNYTNDNYSGTGIAGDNGAIAGVVTGTGSFVKNAVLGTLSMASDTLWQSANILSGGTLARYSDTAQEALVRQQERGQGIVNLVTNLPNAPEFLAKEWNTIVGNYQSGNVRQAFDRGAQDLLGVASVLAPVVGGTMGAVRVGMVGDVSDVGVAASYVDAVANSEVSRVVLNKQARTAREVLVTKELQDLYPSASVQREMLLRTPDGAKAIDPLTETGRRIDQVVIQDGQALDSVETTSQTATKAAQIAKENRIRQQGGTFIRDRETGQLIDLKDIPTRIIRKD